MVDLSKQPPTPEVEQATIDRRPLIYAGVGLFVTLLAMAVGAIFLYAIYDFFFTSGNGPSNVVAQGELAATEEATATLTPTSTPTTDPGPERSLDQQVSEPPTATPLPPQPTSPPTIRPQLVANSDIDFSSTPVNWDYLWTLPGTNDWQPMVYESREYGTCWYAKDYVRICQESGHPGNGADIAWHWTSPVPGPLEILIRVEKIDAGGDGVIVSVFNNTTDTSTDPVYSRPLLGNDERGIANRFIIENIQPGNFLLFVMERNEDVIFDHTAFEVAICQVSCP